MSELQALGKATAYRMDYAPEVLETFENQHPENDYFVKFNCPEFTSLCPITGQPDFATIYTYLAKLKPLYIHVFFAKKLEASP